MRIVAISQQECGELLQRVSLGRLACSLNDQPYVVPVAFSYEPDCIYIFSTVGKKIEWMRQNPKVCLQADEMGHPSSWASVVVTGTWN
jgi:nitroimidazol reductase NimA-like FMN-containing flavoprotein (pyridoxamine 5'-phosphate oxidase superfamily)